MSAAVTAEAAGPLCARLMRGWRKALPGGLPPNAVADLVTSFHAGLITVVSGIHTVSPLGDVAAQFQAYAGKRWADFAPGMLQPGHSPRQARLVQAAFDAGVSAGWRHVTEVPAANPKGRIARLKELEREMVAYAAGMELRGRAPEGSA